MRPSTVVASLYRKRVPGSSSSGAFVMLTTNCGKRDRSRSHLQPSIELRGAVAEARRVQQQILDGDFARRLARRARAAFLHHHVLELGQELRCGIGQPKLAFLDQHHHRDRGHGLGHRVDRGRATARSSAPSTRSSAGRPARGRRACRAARPRRRPPAIFRSATYCRRSAVASCSRSVDMPTASGRRPRQRSAARAQQRRSASTTMRSGDEALKRESVGTHG